MFILKRQDVEIESIQHPTKGQKIPLLSYQGQAFRLLSVFGAAQEGEARALWRELTDNRGKICILLEETDRFSVWGKVRQDALEFPGATAETASIADTPICTQACLLILQALRDDVEDLLGAKQLKRFEQELIAAGAQKRLPQANTPQAVNTLLQLDPLADRLPVWQEMHLVVLLQELHRIGKLFFGQANFVERALDALDELSDQDRTLFTAWLEQSPCGDLWQ